MCDYSLQHVQSRPAKQAEKLVTRNFGLGTRGFCSPGATQIPQFAFCRAPNSRSIGRSTQMVASRAIKQQSFGR